MNVNYCMPVIPSADLEKSLRFWTEGLGLAADREMREDGRLVGCMVHREAMFFWLNQRAGEPVPEHCEGVRFYWTPDDLLGIHRHLKNLGYGVSEIVAQDYGQSEFFLVDDDGYSHCFGMATNELPKNE
ncbi:VOC family protein [Mucilaginibacter boryungensis]|uniref:VOC family protein n=2 Tax=Mucilaginibacter boryungensis TaxID=768480 RepID=A0ABR9XJQ7_9SPHI|nr:VOC family protein [Mucilaginibacter boryungensis]MBE9667632.1 VOC family protein [Mucilaginibacter boryungensis]